METRRGFVRGAVAGGAGALASAYLGAEAAQGARGPLGVASSEVDVLARLLDIEQLVAFAYRHVLGSTSLSASAASMVRSFLGQELLHVHTLAAQLSRRGRRVPGPPTSLQAVEGALAALGVHQRLAQLRTESQALRLLYGVEAVEQNALHDAIVKLSSGTLSQLLAEMLTCEAQHWTVLTEVGNRGNVQRAVPHALVPLTAVLKT